MRDHECANSAHGRNITAMIPRSFSVTLTAIMALAGACLTDGAEPASAQTIFKCVDAAGAVSYQDHACKAGTTETRQEILAAEAATQAPTPAQTPFDKLPTPLHSPPSPPPAPEPPPVTVKPAVPPIWFCTRPEDDSHYVSRDGQPPQRWVPAGIVGIPRRGLAQSYGPGAGAGVTAPGASPPAASNPIVPPRDLGGRRAGGYVEVNDECVLATEQQACEYLYGELDDVDRKLRRAFKDDRAVLEPQQEQLRRDLEGC